MKIALTARVLSPQYNHGRPDGMSTYTRQLREGFVQRGHEVESLHEQAGAAATFAATSLMAAAGLPALGRKWGKAPKGSKGEFREGGAQVMHVTDYRVVPSRTPVVVTLYDAIPFVQPELASPKWRGLKNSMLRAAAGYAERVIAISQHSVAEIVEHFGVKPERISVIPCGVDSLWLEAIPSSQVAAVLKRRQLEAGYFLSVGILQPRKNLERALAAHDLLPAELRRARPLVVVGRAGWRSEALLQQLQAKAAHGEARWFNDVQTLDELRALYAGAGSFVFPSLHEGFGLPILEAFASGIPVVTSNVSALPEVSAGIGFEVDPYSVDALHAALLASLDSNERERRIPAGRKQARAMTWGVCVEATLRVYNDLLRSK